MSFIAKLHRARAILEQNGRLSTRALERELGLGGDELDELVEELVHVQQVARREGKILIWKAAEVRGAPSHAAALAPSPSAAADSRSTEARKVVTIVFADLVGSTALHERLDPESVSRFMDDYYRTVRTPVEAHGGSVIQLLGDGVMCAFGVPRVAEDDAIRAVRAAVAMQRAFAEFAAAHGAVAGAIGLRVAVNTGEVVVSDDHPAGIGDPLNVAARLQQEARDGDVLIGESTARLVRERVTLERVGTFSLKGRAETVTAYRVVSVERPAVVPATAFVGREEEIGRLLAVYETALSAPGARLAVVLGSPGLGKSRLLVELARRLGDRATVLTAQCDAAGGATFAPLAGALRAHLRLDGSGSAGEALRAALAAALPGDAPEPARIVGGIAALLAGAPAPPEETFFVVRRLLAGLASVRPVVLALDDLQWAEPLLLDLVEHLVQWGAGTPLLVLAAARPDLRDSRSSLARSGGLVSEVVTLAGLDAAAATRLAANVIGTDVLPAAVAGRVLATSEGNPLFVGELVRMLVDDGALVRDGDRWTVGVELAALEMPPTIQALLAARIERLGVEERTVLERAAVLGRQFSRAAVAHLLPAELRASLDARLETLRRTELIEPDNAWFLGEPALRFHHGLTRDAAYRRVLKGTRAELHARCAAWIASRSGDAIEHDETIGWHLEQAHQNLCELGPLDARGRALGERASRHLAAAGRRALARDDLLVAANLLGRAVELLDGADPQRADLALDWCEALLAAGDVGPAAEAVAELGRFASAGDEDRGSGVAEGNRQRASSLSSSDPDSRLPTPDSLRDAGRGRLRAWHTCFAGELAVLTDPQALRATAEAVAAAAEELAAAGDTGGEAKARSVQAMALSRLGRVGASEAALDQALAAARRANDRRRSNAVLAGAPLAALYGPSPVTRASGRCLDVVRVLRITQGAPAVEAVALSCQGVLEALRGRTDAARRMIASARRMVEELGIANRLFEADVFAARIELMEGDAAEAERLLRTAYEGLRALGLGIDAAQAGALLARTLLIQDRIGEAEALSHESEALAGDDLQAAIAWRGVCAEALARRGEHGDAIALAKVAVAIASATDALLDHAGARLALAMALRAAGRGAEAEAEEHCAIELWESKGATLLVERARRSTTMSASAGSASANAVPSSRTPRLHVQSNYATRHLARIDEAVAAGDVEAVRWLLGATRALDHVSGRAIGPDLLLEYFRWTIERTGGLAYGNEPVAALGPKLALARWHESGSHVLGDDLPAGPFEIAGSVLVEAEPDLRSTYVEIFAADRLGDAVVRLYERHAELLSEGPERERAAATARFVKLACDPAQLVDLDFFDAMWAPDVTVVDRRRLPLPTAVDAIDFRRIMTTLVDAATGVSNHLEDVLAARPDAWLFRMMSRGTSRTSGGMFEFAFLWLAIFGADGRAIRTEWFDDGADAEALARFDELVPSPAGGLAARQPRPRARRVQPNNGTACCEALTDAVAARDAATVAGLQGDVARFVLHAAGIELNRQETLEWWRLFFEDPGAGFRLEPLGALGDSLVLARQSWSGAASYDASFAAGPFQRDALALIEADPQRRAQRVEIFAPENLAAVLVRLYERFAELQPEGQERIRAAATARSVAAAGKLLLDPDHATGLATAFASDYEMIDHRTAGFGSGDAQLLRLIYATTNEMADDLAGALDDVLGLHPIALLTRWTAKGRDREGGGAFEWPYLLLHVFGADGLVQRSEVFDVDKDVEAVARFDELILSQSKGPSRPSPGPGRRAETQTRETAPGAAHRRLRENAASANAAHLNAALAARDAAALPAIFADDSELTDHRVGATYDRDGSLRTWRSFIRRQGEYHHETLATLGDSLALCRQWMSGNKATSNTLDVGAWEIESLLLIEVDAWGRRRRLEIFAAEHLDRAVVRLYERHAERLPEGPERERTAAVARSVAVWSGLPDLDPFPTWFTPDAECVDHRILGTWSARGAEAILEHWRSYLDLTADSTLRHDDVLALEADALLVHTTYLGTDRTSGGPYEFPILFLLTFAADGLVTHCELFDPDQDAEALARFDELMGSEAPHPAEVFANAATRFNERFTRAWAARDWDALMALHAPTCQVEDRRRLMRLEGGIELTMAVFRVYFEVPNSRWIITPLATRGERVALSRLLFEGDVDVEGGGNLAIDYLCVDEVDGEGRSVAIVVFDPDDPDAAYAELDARWEAGEGAALGDAVTRFGQTFAGRDWETVAALCAPTLVEHDHRRITGLGTTRGVDAWVENVRSWVDLAPDTVGRLTHVRGCDRGALIQVSLEGSREGGRFEIVLVGVGELDERGRFERIDVYDPEQLQQACARFEELRT